VNGKRVFKLDRGLVYAPIVLFLGNSEFVN
jgi:hypothetical protein